MQHFPKHKTKKQCKLKSNNNILKGLDYSKTYLTVCRTNNRHSII